MVYRATYGNGSSREHHVECFRLASYLSLFLPYTYLQLVVPLGDGSTLFLVYSLFISVVCMYNLCLFDIYFLAVMQHDITMVRLKSRPLANLVEPFGT